MPSSDPENAEWERRPLLPGPSSFQLSRWGLWALPGLFVGAAGAALRAFTIVDETEHLDALTIAFLALFGGCALLAWMFDRLSERRLRHEVRAGYTTSRGGNYEVECRHSPTGVVLRRAGQGPLSREQEAKAMKAVRAYVTNLSRHE